MTAGAMQFTSTPQPATSLPSDLVIPITAALLAEYAEAFGLPSLPAIEATLTTRPYCRSSILRKAARLQKNVPSQLIANTRRHSSSGMSTARTESPPTPAEQTRMSRPPSSESTRATAASPSSDLVTSPRIGRTSSWRPLGSTSSTATRAPLVRSNSTVAAPIPLAPPVTRATRPPKSYAFTRSLISRPRTGRGLGLSLAGGVRSHRGLPAREPEARSGPHARRARTGGAHARRASLRSAGRLGDAGYGRDARASGTSGPRTRARTACGQPRAGSRADGRAGRGHPRGLHRSAPASFDRRRAREVGRPARSRVPGDADRRLRPRSAVGLRQAESSPRR